MTILYTQVVNKGDGRILASSESAFGNGFEKTEEKTLKEMREISSSLRNVHDTSLFTTESRTPNVTIFHKSFDGIVILSAITPETSKEATSSFFDILHKRFLETCGGGKKGSAIRFGEIIREESTKISELKGLEHTNRILEETKEVCVKNYRMVLERGQKMEKLEEVGSRLHSEAINLKRKSTRMRMEAVAGQYIFYVVLLLLLGLSIYLILRH